MRTARPLVSSIPACSLHKVPLLCVGNHPSKKYLLQGGLPHMPAAGGMLSDFASMDRQWRSTGSLTALLPLSTDKRGVTAGNGLRSGALRSKIAAAVLAVLLLLICSATVLRCDDDDRCRQILIGRHSLEQLAVQPDNLLAARTGTDVIAVTIASQQLAA